MGAAKGINMAEECHTVNALPPVDIGGAPKTSDYFHLRNHAHASITISMGAVGNDTLIKLYESKDNAGAVKQFKTFKVYKELVDAGDTLATPVLAPVGGFQTGTEDNTHFVIEVDASELSTDYKYLAVLTDGAAAALISIEAKLSGSRYQGDPSKAAITATD